MTAPTFAPAAAALLTTFPPCPWVAPTGEEREVADLLVELDELHQPGADQPDRHGRWGRCTGCLEPWPCPGWTYGDQLALQWVGRAAARVYAHARVTLDATAVPR